MMLDISLGLFGLGMLAGTLAALLYLAGLALTLRVALRCEQTVMVLILSSATRIALLLVAGAATASAGMAAVAGFSCSFLLTRTVILLMVRQRIDQGA